MKKKTQKRVTKASKKPAMRDLAPLADRAHRVKAGLRAAKKGAAR